MKNNNIILKLLGQLRDYLEKLSQLQQHTEQDFLTDWHIEWEIDRGFQVAIECSIDIGQEIITNQDLQKPSTYAETFLILQRAKIIPQPLSNKMQFLANYRNKLVHDYLFLDPRQKYKTFKENLEYIKEYLRVIEKFVKSELK